MLLASLIAALGCVDELSSDQDVSSTQQPIYFGTPDTDPEHDAVVAIAFASDSTYFCTGTLIRRSVVLTAAHCLEDLTPEDLVVFFGDDANVGQGDYRDVSELLSHPKYDPDELSADIALISLAEKAPKDISPIPYLPKKRRLTSDDQGLDVVFAGFGLTETMDEGVKLRADGTITLVCDDEPCVSGLVVPKSFYFAMENGGPCVGDSGGPTFVVREGREYVAGVTSYGDPGCTEYGVNTTVSDYTGFISDFTDGGCSASRQALGGAGPGFLAALLMLLGLRRRRSHV